ncbi:MAG: SIMPL domain-containing protein [Odoribacteraceae bacterium]|jgi:uncharacterized protein YggE|nr:SIMPL domain-containing protein [Odoribacteraceae bacterium]
MEKMINTIAAIFLFAIALASCAGNREPGTVSVTGTGTVLAPPDMIRVNISLSHLARTTRQAREKVNAGVKQALDILAAEEIKSKDISTPALRFSQEYTWHDQKRVLVGQRAEQSIEFSVNDIRQDSAKISRILDKLTGIEELALNSVNFSVRDNRTFFVQSRELAYRKAVEKAEQYAALAGLKIIKVQAISEGSAQASPIGNRMMKQQSNAVLAEVVSDGGVTTLPTGELEITTHLSVIFLLGETR